MIRKILAAATVAIAMPTWAVDWEEISDAFQRSDFDRASELLDAYTKARKKGAPREDDLVYDPAGSGQLVDRAQLMRSSVELGKSMMARVERVTIIDRLAVPSDMFFEYYNLARSAGNLTATLPDGLTATGAVMWPAWVSEDSSTVAWSGTLDGADINTDWPRLLMTTRLADGTWEAAANLGSRRDIFDDEIDGTVTTPWLMPDGMTFYFAADGPTSLGGLDIYITRLGNDGTLLQPSNLGMPYNSPYDDYMLAIDEESGIGWWVSDREQLDGMVTIYVFVPAQLRVNYPADTEHLRSLATLDDIDLAPKATAKYPQKETEAEAEPQFRLELADGRVLTQTSEVTDAEARKLLPRLIQLNGDIADRRAELSRLRASWTPGNSGATAAILSAERQLETDEKTLADVRSRIAALMSPTQ